MVRWAFCSPPPCWPPMADVRRMRRRRPGTIPTPRRSMGARKHHKHKKPEPEGRQITVHKGTALTPSQSDGRDAGPGRDREQLRDRHVRRADADRGHVLRLARTRADHSAIRRARRAAVQFLISPREAGRAPRPRLRSRAGRASPSLRSHARLDGVAGPALVVDRHAPLGIEDQIVLDARQREIAAELAAVIDRRGAWRQDFDDDDGTGDEDRVIGQPRAATITPSDA